MREVLALLCAAVAATQTPSLQAMTAPDAGKAVSVEHAARIESGLPSVTSGRRTLHLSLSQWMDALAVPGVSIAVIDDYRIVWTKGYGATSTGPNGAQITPDTLFQAASIAKPVTALAVLLQVERGTFELDADINHYLQSWKLPRSDIQHGEAVTIRRLLAHAGGVTPGGFQGYAPTASLPTIVQVLSGEAPATNGPARVVSKPGSEVAYSGLGYSLLQLALEDSLDQSFGTIMQDTVLEPLKLDDSSFTQPLPEAYVARAARGHLGIGTAIDGGWFLYPELAAAGLWTTPTDLAKFAIEVADLKRGKGQLISRGLARQMLSPHRDEMGLGFVVRDGETNGYFAHSGGNLGYFAHFEMLADTGQGIAIMTNADAGQLLASLIIASVAKAYDWPLLDRRQVSPDRIDRLFAQFDLVANKRVRVEVNPAVLARYVGKYELEPGMLFNITFADGQLQLQLGDQPRFPMFAESDGKFFLEVVDAQITFVMDADGEPTALVLHQGGRDQRAPRIK